MLPWHATNTHNHTHTHTHSDTQTYWGSLNTLNIAASKDYQGCINPLHPSFFSLYLMSECVSVSVCSWCAIPHPLPCSEQHTPAKVGAVCVMSHFLPAMGGWRIQKGCQGLNHGQTQHGATVSVSSSNHTRLGTWIKVWLWLWFNVMTAFELVSKTAQPHSSQTSLNFTHLYMKSESERKLWAVTS